MSGSSASAARSAQRGNRAGAIAHQKGDVGAILLNQGAARRHARGLVEQGQRRGVVAAPRQPAGALGAGAHRRVEGLGQHRRSIEAAQRLARRLVVRTVAQRSAVVGDGRIARATALQDDGAIVVALGMERRQDDGTVAFRQRLVDAPERAERTRPAGA